MEQGIHDGHRKRLREFMDKVGPYNMNDINYLEYLLTFVIKRGDTNPIAHRLLDEFVTIDEIFDASYEALIKVKGVGDKTARFLQSMSVNCYMYNKSKALKRPYIKTNAEVINFLKAIIPPSINEQFVVLKMTKDYRVVNFKIFEGVSHSFVTFDSVKLGTYLIDHKTQFCLFAHTHPNSTSDPSQEDIKTFASLTNILNSLKITLFDNVILGKDDFFSSRIGETTPYNSIK